jgi:hypothetical protein
MKQIVSRPRHRSRRFDCLTFAALMFVVLVAPPAADAQLISPAPVLGTTTVLASTGPMQGGTSDALHASELSGSIPGLLSADIIRAVTIGWEDETAAEASVADLELNIAGITISADVVMARAKAVFGVAGVGITDIANLSINGTPVTITGSPNQTIGLPGGVLIINEQQVAADGTSSVVNALHVMVSGVADVVVASATASTTVGQASAIVASY